MSSKERHFEVVVRIEQEHIQYDDTPMEDIKWSIKDELAREHNIDCECPRVEIDIREVKYNDEV
jgi:hypothetical protein